MEIRAIKLWSSGRISFKRFVNNCSWDLQWECVENITGFRRSMFLWCWCFSNLYTYLSGVFLSLWTPLQWTCCNDGECYGCSLKKRVNQIEMGSLMCWVTLESLAVRMLNTMNETLQFCSSVGSFISPRSWVLRIKWDSSLFLNAMFIIAFQKVEIMSGFEYNRKVISTIVSF